jgi:hypothetical protein
MQTVRLGDLSCYCSPRASLGEKSAIRSPVYKAIPPEHIRSQGTVIGEADQLFFGLGGGDAESGSGGKSSEPLSECCLLVVQHSLRRPREVNRDALGKPPGRDGFTITLSTLETAEFPA